MKKFLLIISSCLLMILILPMQLNAASVNSMERNEVQDGTLRSVILNDQISKVIGVPRGRILSSVEIQISNEGNGVLGVYADTLCHIGVKQISTIIFLDIWSDEMEDWDQLNYFQYVWNESDHPGKELSVATVSFDLEGLAKGKTYRLRSYHTAKDFDDFTETMGARTSGILLK